MLSYQVALAAAWSKAGDGAWVQAQVHAQVCRKMTLCVLQTSQCKEKSSYTQADAWQAIAIPGVLAPLLSRASSMGALCTGTWQPRGPQRGGCTASPTGAVQADPPSRRPPCSPHPSPSTPPTPPQPSAAPSYVLAAPPEGQPWAGPPPRCGLADVLLKGWAGEVWWVQGWGGSAFRGLGCCLGLEELRVAGRLAWRESRAPRLHMCSCTALPSKPFSTRHLDCSGLSCWQGCIEPYIPNPTSQIINPNPHAGRAAGRHIPGGGPHSLVHAGPAPELAPEQAPRLWGSGLPGQGHSRLPRQRRTA